MIRSHVAYAVTLAAVIGLASEMSAPAADPPQRRPVRYGSVIGLRAEKLAEGVKGSRYLPFLARTPSLFLSADFPAIRVRDRHINSRPENPCRKAVLRSAEPALKVYDEEDHYLLFSQQEAGLGDIGELMSAAARTPRGGEFAVVTAAGLLKRLTIRVAHGPHGGLPFRAGPSVRPPPNGPRGPTSAPTGRPWLAPASTSPRPDSGKDGKKLSGCIYTC